MKKFILLLILSLIPALVLAEETVRTWTTSAGKEMVGVMVDGKSYLCPSDTDLENRDSIVSRDWAFEQLEKCAARQKIFIVDARALEDPIGAKTHGFVLIASCDREQQSWEDETLEHGVFTHFLAEGLSGAAGDEEGYVSILDLFQYASRKTKQYVFREFNRVQVPTFRQGSEMTDFILAKLESDSSSVPPAVSGPVTPPEPPKPAVRKAGERMVKTVDGIEYAFRWCPAGSFLMGSPEDEPGRFDDETQHRVTLTRGFWMLETEVTQAMWKSVMGNNPSEFKSPTRPVECVSWDDCQEFCRKLSSQLGLTVSLPTEAQWEYACRAGSETALPNGPIEILGVNNAPALDPIAWYGGNSSVGFELSNGYDSSGWSEKQYSGNRSGTHPVGKKKPNAWGLYDMIGNVWEWCQDTYDSNYYAASPTSDPCNEDSGSYRVNRGGSWDSSVQGCRSARRNWGTPDYRDSFLGFRPVLASPAPGK